MKLITLHEFSFPIGEEICVVTGRNLLVFRADKVLEQKEVDGDAYQTFLSILKAGAVVAWFDTYNGWYLKSAEVNR